MSPKSAAPTMALESERSRCMIWRRKVLRRSGSDISSPVSSSASATSMLMPHTGRGELAVCRSRVVNTRIEKCIGDIDKKIRADQDHGEEERRPLHHREVSAGDGRDGQGAQAGPGKDILQNDRATEEPAQGKA